MMWTRRSLLAMLLALSLGATSLTMAVARGQARVAGEIVICTGYGMTTLAVDAAGTPIGRLHICPDMALALLVTLDAPRLDLSRPEGRSEQLARPAAAAAISHRGMTRRARSPPRAA